MGSTRYFVLISIERIEEGGKGMLASSVPPREKKKNRYDSTQ